jgi:hypothetical protein
LRILERTMSIEGFVVLDFRIVGPKFFVVGFWGVRSPAGSGGIESTTAS